MSDSEPVVYSWWWLLVLVSVGAALWSVVMWAWLGPFAGMLWSMFCIFLGAMIEALRRYYDE